MEKHSNTISLLNASVCLVGSDLVHSVNFQMIALWRPGHISYVREANRMFPKLLRKMI